jgi:hypothetical protein
MFSRLPARRSGAKTSKDSPVESRVAILSFLSGMGQNEHELDYFVYMMVRKFIPKIIDMKIVNCGHQCREHIMIKKAAAQDLSTVHIM